MLINIYVAHLTWLCQLYVGVFDSKIKTLCLGQCILTVLSAHNIVEETESLKLLSTEAIKQIIIIPTISHFCQYSCSTYYFIRVRLWSQDYLKSFDFTSDLQQLRTFVLQVSHSFFKKLVLCLGCPTDQISTCFIFTKVSILNHNPLCWIFLAFTTQTGACQVVQGIVTVLSGLSHLHSHFPHHVKYVHP